jgi:uncharacterized membrane protein YtjA (UPF0391 family)
MEAAPREAAVFRLACGTHRWWFTAGKRGGIMLIYYALALFVVALGALLLGFMDVVHGAAGVANIALVLSLVLLAVAAFSNYRGRRMIH